MLHRWNECNGGQFAQVDLLRVLGGFSLPNRSFLSFQVESRSDESQKATMILMTGQIFLQEEQS